MPPVGCLFPGGLSAAVAELTGPHFHDTLKGIDIYTKAAHQRYKRPFKILLHTVTHAPLLSVQFCTVWILHRKDYLPY